MLQKYTCFIGLCLGFFIIMMDITTVPLTYTTLMHVFNVGPAIVAWINNIYLITYAAFLLLGGRLGDSLNRKSVVLAAYLAIAIGAAISGAGKTFIDVTIGRALMGIGAGLLTPQSMAYISILFVKGGRGTALGIWGAVAGIATATGPVITQLFLTIASWRWVMWINIPIAIICFLIAILSLPNKSGYGFQFRSTLVVSLYGICLAGVIVGIQLFSVVKSTMIVGGSLVIGGATVAAILIKNDLKKQYNHILSSKLWFDSSFLRVCLISGLLGAALTSFYLPLAFLLDVRMKFGPVAISSIMVIIALSNALVGPFAGSISDRMEPKRMVKFGLILFAIANTLLGLISLFLSGKAFAFLALCVVMMIAGTGTGLAFAPLANLALRRTQVENVGQAAAFFNSVRQMSSALGGVVTAIVFDSVIRMQLGYGFKVTIVNLRKSLNITGIASFTCFFLVALILSIAAYLSRRHKEEETAECSTEVLKT